MPFEEGQSGNPERVFTKGTSGNPGGRPKKFAKVIREKCGHDYERLVEALCVIAFGNAEACETFFGEPVRVKTRDRLDAIEMLRDSGPGKPTQVHDIELPPDVPLFAPGFIVAVETPAMLAAKPADAPTALPASDAASPRHTETPIGVRIGQ